MNRVKRILLRIGQSKALKYAVVIAAAVAIVGFIGENSILSHLRNKLKIAELKSEIKRYNGLYEHDMQQLRQLDRNPKAIEKIARERYFMKTDDEDIFVLSDDERVPQHLSEDEATE